jgi:hypothetical protein
MERKSLLAREAELKGGLLKFSIKSHYEIKDAPKITQTIEARQEGYGWLVVLLKLKIYISFI